MKTEVKKAIARHLKNRGKNSYRLIISHKFDRYRSRIKYTKSIHVNKRN